MNDTEDKIDPRKLAVSDLIWDLMPHTTDNRVIHRMQDRLGLVPSDVEGLAVEHRLSDARKEAIKPIFPTLGQLASWSAEVIVEKQICEIESNGATVIIDDETKSAIWTQTATSVVSTTTAIVAYMLEKGVIKLAVE